MKMRLVLSDREPEADADATVTPSMRIVAVVPSYVAARLCHTFCRLVSHG